MYLSVDHHHYEKMIITTFIARPRRANGVSQLQRRDRPVNCYNSESQKFESQGYQRAIW